MTKVNNILLNLYHKHIYLIRYCFIGGIGATLDFLLYLVLHYKFGLNPAIATFLSVSVGIINNYILNVMFNFKVRTHLLHRFVNFYLIGAGGAIFSSIFIYILFDIYSVNATAAKLLSIPFVVVIQFALNRKLSFQENFTNNLLHKSLKILSKNVWLAIINLMFLVCCLGLVKVIPDAYSVKGAPDEAIQFRYNVAIIENSHRLPISGKDDLSAYKNCRDNKFGRVSCLYSYEVYPQASYVINALVSKIAHKTFNLSYSKGSRIASVLWGLIFLNFLYFGLRKLLLPWQALMLAGSVAFIPQVLFIFSYTNQDAPSLAISAVLFYSLVNYLKKRTLAATVLLSIAAGGFLPLTKYNYLITILPIASILIFLLLKKSLAIKELSSIIIFSIIAFIILALPWYIRNIVLYHDALGQSFMLSEMAKFHSPGISHPLNVSTLLQYVRLGFFDSLFNSFFVAFGYMTYFLSPDKYSIIQGGIIGLLVFFIYIIFSSISKEESKKLLVLLTGYMIFFVLTLALVFYNSTYYDFQAQGRYLYPLLVPFAFSVALAVQISKRVIPIIPMVAGISIFCFINALELVINVYT